MSLLTMLTAYFVWSFDRRRSKTFCSLEESFLWISCIDRKNFYSLPYLDSAGGEKVPEVVLDFLLRCLIGVFHIFASSFWATTRRSWYPRCELQSVFMFGGTGADCVWGVENCEAAFANKQFECLIQCVDRLLFSIINLLGTIARIFGWEEFPITQDTL